MKFRCRMTRPKISDWVEVEATSAEEAVADLHFYAMDRDGFHFSAYAEETPQGEMLQINFACMQAEGHEEVVSRVYHSGIHRKGGVKALRPPLPQRLTELANKLGWTKDPMLLISPGWIGESSEWESRSSRRVYEGAAGA